MRCGSRACEFTCRSLRQVVWSPPRGRPAPITDIEWDAERCAAVPAVHLGRGKSLRVSVALGNIVLADHGEAQPVDELPQVPDEKRSTPAARTRRRLLRSAASRRVCRRATGRCWRDLPLTHGFDLADLLKPPADAPQDFWSAAALRALDPRDAMPQVLSSPARSNGQDDDWIPRSAICWRATMPRATSSSRSRTTAALACASATTARAGAPRRRPRFKATLPRRQRRRRQRRAVKPSRTC